MIKNILIPLDGSEHSTAALDYGMWMAEKFGGTLFGQHIIDTISIEGTFFHDISGSLGFEPYLDFSTKRFKLIERPLLAYDGSQRSSAAMESAAEFCTVLGLPLTILTVAKEQQAGENIIQQAKSYLNSYSIETRYEIDRGYPEQRIIDYLTKFEYDLLFIGAYGHKRIIEMVLGSTTEYVLRKSPCPVFLNR